MLEGVCGSWHPGSSALEACCWRSCWTLPWLWEVAWTRWNILGRDVDVGSPSLRVVDQSGLWLSDEYRFVIVFLCKWVGEWGRMMVAGLGVWLRCSREGLSILTCTSTPKIFRSDHTDTTYTLLFLFDFCTNYRSWNVKAVVCGLFIFVWFQVWINWYSCCNPLKKLKLLFWLRRKVCWGGLTFLKRG